MERNSLELYLHIPFCVRKCSYCDFISFAGKEDRMDAYVDALCREISLAAEEYRDRTVVSVYIGGGTPSVLSIRQISKIAQTLQKAFSIHGTHEKRKGLYLQKRIRPSVEFSIECNPGTVDKQKLKAYRKLGINRLSIGLQSTDNEDLKTLGRIHDYEAFVRTFETAREVGFDNINIDLMQAIPGQTLAGWQRVMAIAGTWAPEHISAYSLIVEEGTPFYELQKQGRLFLPDEDTERRIYSYTKEFLEKAGYHRYEISNYAKPGFECRHNIGYWKRVNYLGLGLNASSLADNVRWKNTSDLDLYLEKLSSSHESVKGGAHKSDDASLLCAVREEREILSPKDQMEEYLMLGLRLSEGISKSEFLELFHMDFDYRYQEVIARMRSLRLLETEGDRVRLTDSGVDVSNQVIGAFLNDPNLQNS